ncbi:uncharacterized protein CIMG_03792 [Coccidioides immitis RS]|uniref:Aminoglycoside phosphotransferase domain-containing protein n=3 Tax=Coccidioides immitis TaxID=5501 RepID=A0A0E1RYF9_COCIM|nr:uncharacterized protein CIMG_03792 [Coccidioides immitis RS]EAS32768.1 hypothetical protein CIMG_03792 [Coccidioides immitis RS]KMP08032.1 hypothetical protein CIRG_07713 [Coccidioides immitis RMSCC 2394]KMU79682.1 hypothetical protein CISG_02100 [Coccidioides immitis RMSCC 3703]
MSSTLCKGSVDPGPDFSAFQRLVKSLFPGAQIESIRMTEGSTYPIHFLQISNGLELVLKTRPLSSPSVLRHERFLLETEAEVLSLLWQSRVEGIPQPLKTDLSGFPPRTGYLLRRSVKGKPLSKIDSPLTSDERKCLDRQLGAVVKSIGRHTSSQFGLVHSVALGIGTRTWRQAFLSLLDSLMWDAENVFISLPYPEIRQHAGRLSKALDDVMVPQLVVLDIGKPSHIILDPETKQLAGVVDFDSALWGDPLMADVFDSPSPEFLDGFGSDLIETKSAPIRLLLYSCYRNILKVARQYYRNREEDEELAARRVLTAHLATLSTLEYP